MKPIPNNLRALRKGKGLTQLQVAKYLGHKSAERISKWESGKLYPHVLNFLKLAKFYDASPFDLFQFGKDQSDEGP